MKKRSSNPIELRRSSGAVKVDLSSADKTIRRPGSEPDLNNSPIRSSLRQTASGKALIKAYLFDWSLAEIKQVKMWRQNIDSHWNFLYSAQILHCHSPVLVLSIQSKTWSSFLSALLNWHKNSNFFKLAVLRSDSIKQNYGGPIFNKVYILRGKH